MRRNPPPRGFTLIEISVVIAILGLLLLIGMVKMDTLTPERSLESAARMLRASLEEMHSAALLRGVPAMIVYNLTEGSYRLESPPPPPDPDALASLPSPPETFLEGHLPEGVAFKRILRRGMPDQADGELKLRITSGGACPPHAVVLGLASGATARRTLRVDPLSGAVEIAPEEKPFDQLFVYLPDERDPPSP